MGFNQFQDLEIYKSRATMPQTKKNPFLWLLPLILLWAGYQVAVNYSDYGYMQTVRNVDFSRLKEGLDRYTLPKTFGAEVKKIADEKEYSQAYKKAAQNMKLSIGFYMAIAVVALGLLWRDMISVFGVSVFLLMTCVYRLVMMGEIPYIDFSLFFILMALTLTMEKKRGA